MYFPKPSLNENDLAIIERGDTAAHSIEAGQYVSWKGRTGKAKAAILQGATLDDTLFDYDEDGALNASTMKFPDYVNASKVSALQKDFSTGNASSTWTATTTGFLALTISKTAAGGVFSIIINNVTIFQGSAWSGGHFTTMIPIVTGDTVRLTVNDSNGFKCETAKLIPFR